MTLFLYDNKQQATKNSLTIQMDSVLINVYKLILKRQISAFNLSKEEASITILEFTQKEQLLDVVTSNTRLGVLISSPSFSLTQTTESRLSKAYRESITSLETQMVPSNLLLAMRRNVSHCSFPRFFIFNRILLHMHPFCLQLIPTPRCLTTKFPLQGQLSSIDSSASN